MDAKELKPCPFCGGTPHFERLGTGRQSCIVECGSCGVRHESGDDGAMCGNSWNYRAALPSDAAQAPFANDSQYIVIGYGESDYPQAAFAETQDELLDAVLGMIYTRLSDVCDDTREEYRRDLADEDEWSAKVWRTEFEIGGIVVYDTGERVQAAPVAPQAAGDAAQAAWISVTDRLPEIHEFRPGSGSGISDPVLVLLAGEDEGMAVWSYRRGGRGDTTTTYWDCCEPKVTHWMPLPALPSLAAPTAPAAVAPSDTCTCGYSLDPTCKRDTGAQPDHTERDLELVAQPDERAAFEAPNRDNAEYSAVIDTICAKHGWRRNKAALIDEDEIFRMRTDDAVALWVQARATAPQATVKGDAPWIECWHGSEPFRGWSIFAGRERIAYIGGDETLSEAVSEIVQTHNRAAVPQASALTDGQIADALEVAGVKWQWIGNAATQCTRGSTDASAIIAGVRALLSAAQGGGQ